MIDKKCFEEMSKDEVLTLNTVPHHFCHYNWVYNSSSTSTPFRMVSNTSNVASCTTISTEQLSPANILNPHQHGLIRFSLHRIPLCSDVAGAYHTISVDEASSFLRLFFYWWDLPQCTKARLFRQTSQSFGDGGAAQGLKVAILKFVVATSILLVTRYLRYLDNILYSFKTKQE